MCNLSEAIAEKNLEKGKLEMLFLLIEQGLLTKEDAAQAVNMELETFNELLESTKKD